MTTPLLDWTPPNPPVFHGETFDAERDGKRLNAQSKRVFMLMRDGKKRSLSDMSGITGDPPASISARFRDLKRHGFDMRKQYVSQGLWVYWMHIGE